jgi:hypothetical protein
LQEAQGFAFLAQKQRTPLSASSSAALVMHVFTFFVILQFIKVSLAARLRYNNPLLLTRSHRISSKKRSDTVSETWGTKPWM